MALTLHALLRGFASMTGFMCGGLAGDGLYALLIGFLVDGIGIDPDAPAVMVPQMIFAVVVVFGGAVLGLKFGGALVTRHVPAYCPACRGRAYPYDGKEVGRQVAYRCGTCLQVNLVPFYATR